MYEGLVKLINPNWTAALYLKDSHPYLKDFFVSLTNDPVLLNWVNQLNIWSLIIIGFCIILGGFTKIASLGGIGLLVLFTMSHPALVDSNYVMPMEGSYLWVDKNIIEIGALLVIMAFPTYKEYGLDRFLKRKLGRLI